MGIGDPPAYFTYPTALPTSWHARSGLGKESTKFTEGEHVARGDGKKGYGRKGGQPWTEKWLK